MDTCDAAHEAHILQSWRCNAAPWTRIVQADGIASRKAATNQAIIEAVTQLGLRRVLDVGCGEGWLVRALRGRGIDAFGIDAVPALIAAAQAQGDDGYQVCSYADLTEGRFGPVGFDLAVCNFSLLGRDSVNRLCLGLRRHLAAPGYLVIQTLHPVAACGTEPYVDGWRTSSWTGFGEDFVDPPPWYFRTLGSWYALLRAAGFDVLACREPTAPGALLPAAIIFICRCA